MMADHASQTIEDDHTAPSDQEFRAKALINFRYVA
jgi:hypothetical protein